MLMFSSRPLIRNFLDLTVSQSRSITRIPHWENHIRFDPHDARKRPSQDVLDRFRRLNNGMWIRAHPGRHTMRYRKNEINQQISLNYETCTKDECEMLDAMMTPFWLRKKHYVDDPYEVYNVRHGLNSPRVDYKKRFVRERTKILMDDLTAEKYFDDR